MKTTVKIGESKTYKIKSSKVIIPPKYEFFTNIRITKGLIRCWILDIGQVIIPPKYHRLGGASESFTNPPKKRRAGIRITKAPVDTWCVFLFILRWIKMGEVIFKLLLRRNSRQTVNLKLNPLDCIYGVKEEKL